MAKEQIETNLKVGDIVDGRYRLLDLLGEGAAGKVFRAEDLGRGNLFVALKLLHAKDPRWEEFFRREFEVLSRLQHPNLVRVYDFGPAPASNTWYFTQELVVGKPLLDAAAGKHVKEVAGLFIEICRALEFIHAHDVLHRDLKPANILVQEHADPGERVRVLDFGLWRELDNTPKKGARWAGTPPYLASEVLRGYGHSISADLYAVGVTLFQSVTRKLPHGRGTPQELLQVRKNDTPDYGRVPVPALTTLIKGLLHEEPSQRPATAAAVADELSRIAPEHAVAMPQVLGKARLVGRDKERAAIEDALAAARRGDRDAPRLLLLEGASGIGKSRLGEELKARFQLEGGRSAVGKCEGDVSWTFRPLAELVRALAPGLALGGLAPEERQVLAQIAPELVPGERASDATVTGSQRDRFTAIAARFFARLGSGKPLLLVVDDVEQCDRASLDVLARVVEHASRRQVAVLVTVNNARNVPRALIDAAAGRVRRVKLEPLPRSGVSALLSGLLGMTNVPPQFVDMIHAASEGVPLLVEELVSLLIERGQLVRAPVGWTFDKVRASGIDTTPAERIQDRVASLNRTGRRVLTALAVLNRPSGVKVLAAVAGVERSAAEKTLPRLETLGLVRIVQSGRKPRVVFRNPRARRAVLNAAAAHESGSRGDLAKWHLQAARVMERRAKGEAGEIAETLAHHFEAGGDAEKAATYLQQAADARLNGGDAEEALRLARSALRLYERMPGHPAGAYTAAVCAGRASVAAGHVPEARALLKAVLREPDLVEHPALYATLVVVYAEACGLMAASSVGVEAAELAMKRLAGSDGRILARLQIARGKLLADQRPIDALKAVRRALKVLDDDTHVDETLAGLEVMARAALVAGKPERALGFARRRKALAERFVRTFDIIGADRQIAVTLAWRGERLEARQHLGQAMQAAKDNGARLEEGRILAALGEQLFVSGSYGEAITRFQEAVAAAAAVGQVVERGRALIWLGRCYLAKGDYTRSIEHLRAAVESLERTDALIDTITAQVYLARAELASGEPVSADGHLRRAATALPRESRAGFVRAQLYDVQGVAASSRTRFSKARKALLYAVVWYRAAKNPFYMARTLTHYAELLLRHGHPARAARLSRYARRVFAALDAKGELKRLQPLLNAAAGLAHVDAQSQRKTKSAPQARPAPSRPSPRRSPAASGQARATRAKRSRSQRSR